MGIFETELDLFWKELTKQIGPIPKTVQVALEQTKFIHAGLVYLDDITINYVEADIRRLPVLLGKSEKEVAGLLDYKGHLKDFRFLVGERCIIKLIAHTIKELGFNTFFMPKSHKTDTGSTRQDVSSYETTTTRAITTKPPVVMNLVDVVDEVKAKIYSYYDQRRVNYEEEEEFFARLSDVEVEFSRDHMGDMAKVICPFCDPHSPTVVMIRRDKPGTWKVSNFSGHIKLKHDNFCIPGGENISREGSRKRSFREANALEYVEDNLYGGHGELDVKIEL